MIKNIIFLSLLIFSSVCQADAITLDDKKDIARAYELSMAIANASSKVMACIEKTGGSPETCACFDKDSCPFKADFETVTNLYCKLKSEYPKWQDLTINYKVEGTQESRVLGMVALERQFGKSCR